MESFSNPSNQSGMEDLLPPPLIIEILNRLNDVTDLARCRATCKTLLLLSYQVNSLSFSCSFDRYSKSRAPETRTLTTPFKSIVNQQLSLTNTIIQNLSIGIERPYRDVFEADDEEDSNGDDLHLTAVDFVSQWLPPISAKLRSLSISDFWLQSCWRCSELLQIISSCCEGLLNLELKNAWLSVKGLKPMPTLTCLTLEYIRLDDEDLNMVNDCFPSLQTLNLIDVGGLKQPRIRLLQLRTCHLAVSSAPASLTIYAPNLIELKLRCVSPEKLVLRAPLLSVLDLSISKPRNSFEIARFLNLKSLRVESSDVHTLKQLILGFETAGNSFIEIPICDES